MNWSGGYDYGVVPATLCSQAALMLELKKKKEGFTAGSPDNSQCTIWSQGSDEHSRLRALGKAFPRKKSYWVMPTERRLCLQIACIS